MFEDPLFLEEIVKCSNPEEYLDAYIEAAGAIINRLSHALRSVGVVCPDVIENLLEVFGRSG